MKAEAPDSEQRVVQTERKLLHIAGPRMVQNELLSYYLQLEIGAECLLYENFHQLPFLASTTLDGREQLALWDVHGRDLKELLVELELYSEEKLSRVPIVLLNVTRGQGLEERLVWKGVHGFLYEQDPMDWLLKGIRTILQGELWLSRKIVTKCILEAKCGTDSDSYPEHILSLTPREIEILALVATWATNSEIAEKLCVSPHTVKSHLYNIFQKLNVQNRRQAALWAIKHLERFIPKP